MGLNLMKVCYCSIIMTLVQISALASASINVTTAVLIRVDQSGHGDFKTIQAAIDSVPPNNAELVFILVKPGTYREKIMVPADKPYITLSGTKASGTIITWNDKGDIFESPTLSVLASDFVGRYLTIQNTYGSGDKAVALRVSGDRAAFYGCRIISYQDTLLDDTGSHYYRNCYIEGATDFIFGTANSLFERCHIHSVSTNGGSITAQHRNSPTENSGFIFLGCKVTGVGVASAFLGRPWSPYARVIYAYSYISSAIFPSGWADWNSDQTRRSTTMFGEYKCYGRGAARTKRVTWSRNLSDEEAAPFLSKEVIGSDWLRASPTFFKRGSRVFRPGHISTPNRA